MLYELILPDSGELHDVCNGGLDKADREAGELPLFSSVGEAHAWLKRRLAYTRQPSLDVHGVPSEKAGGAAYRFDLPSLSDASCSSAMLASYTGPTRMHSQPLRAEAGVRVKAE